MRAPLRAFVVGLVLVATAVIGPPLRATGSAAGPRSRQAKTVTVSMQNLAFSPTTVTIDPGDTVTWTNDDFTAHSVTADDLSFDSSPACPGGACMDPGDTFSHTFTTAGTFHYHCRVHGTAMAGTVVVSGGGATTTTNPPTTSTSMTMSSTTTPGTTAPPGSSGSGGTSTTAPPATPVGTSAHFTG